MKLHQLRYLSAVAAAGGIRAAARALGVSQATVTQGLRELEAHARVALFTRHGGGITLTTAAHDLLQHAQRVLVQLQQAEDALARHRGEGGLERLVVAVTPWVAQTLLPRMLPAFRAELPHVRLEMFDGLSTLAYPRLREGTLDLMIGRIAPAEALQGLQVQPLFRYDMTVVARRGHPLAGARSMAQLLEQDWVLNFAAEEQDALLDNLFGQHGLPAPVHRIQLAHSPSLMLALTRQSDMLTFCPWPLVETDGLRTSVVALSLRERFRSHEVGIVRRAQEAPSHAASRFIAHFLAQVPAWRRARDPELRRVLHSVDLLDAGGPARARR